MSVIDGLLALYRRHLVSTIALIGKFQIHETMLTHRAWKLLPLYSLFSFVFSFLLCFASSLSCLL